MYNNVLFVFFVLMSLSANAVVLPLSAYSRVVDEATGKDDEQSAKLAAAIYQTLTFKKEDTRKKAEESFQKTFNKPVSDYLPKPAVVPSTGDETLDKLIAKKEYDEALAHILSGVGKQVAQSLKGKPKSVAATKEFAKEVGA